MAKICLTLHFGIWNRINKKKNKSVDWMRMRWRIMFPHVGCTYSGWRSINYLIIGSWVVWFVYVVSGLYPGWIFFAETILLQGSLAWTGREDGYPRTRPEYS